MSRLAFCVTVWVFFLSARPVAAASAETYFPLHVGNSWTYVGDGGSTRQFTIIAAQEVQGNTYYQFDDCYQACGFPGWRAEGGVDLLLRYDAESSNVLQYCPSSKQDIVRLDFSGEMWGAFGNQLVQSGISRTVPAGAFDDCLQFDYATLVFCGEFHEILAPGVGTVAFFSSWDGEFQLQDYTIVPEPSTLVLGSMGALALLTSARRTRKRVPRRWR
jgi:hypothetical protein